MDKNKELHELFGLCWHEWMPCPMGFRGRSICSKCDMIEYENRNPDYSDPRLVFREMKEREDWKEFLGYLDDIGYYDTLTGIPELLLDTTGKLRDLAIEYLRGK